MSGQEFGIFLIIFAFWAAISGGIGAVIGNTVDDIGGGFLWGFFLGPIGWLITLLIPREPRAKRTTGKTKPSASPRPNQDLTSDAYKIWLGKTYNIVKNELFEKYECDEKLFDTLDEALVYADSLDAEKREQEQQLSEELIKKSVEKRERERERERQERGKDLELVVLAGAGLVIWGILVIASLIF